MPIDAGMEGRGSLVLLDTVLRRKQRMLQSISIALFLIPADSHARSVNCILNFSWYYF